MKDSNPDGRRPAKVLNSGKHQYDDLKWYTELVTNIITHCIKYFVIKFSVPNIPRNTIINMV